MFVKVATVGFWFGVLTGLLAGANAWAKPADLPSPGQIECADGAPGGLAANPEPSEAPPIDASLPAFVDQWLQHARDMVSRPDRFISVETLWRQLPRVAGTESKAPSTSADKSADALERFFKLAEYYRRAGYLDTAQYYYQRVHLLSPTSRLGRLAIDRLQQVEERMRDDAEEQSQPRVPNKPESRNRQTDDGYMRLGLVRVAY